MGGNKDESDHYSSYDAEKEDYQKLGPEAFAGLMSTEEYENAQEMLKQMAEEISRLEKAEAQQNEQVEKEGRSEIPEQGQQ